MPTVHGLNVDVRKPPVVLGQRGSQVAGRQRGVDPDRKVSTIPATSGFQTRKRSLSLYDDPASDLRSNNSVPNLSSMSRNLRLRVD